MLFFVVARVLLVLLPGQVAYPRVVPKHVSQGWLLLCQFLEKTRLSLAWPPEVFFFGLVVQLPLVAITGFFIIIKLV